MPRSPRATLKITLDNAYMEKCDENILWLDYKNICKVVDVGSKIYVDDGLISLLVKQKGRDRSRSDCLKPAPISNFLARR